MGYNGFDLGVYPGDSEMQAFWTNTPFNFTGFYLGPAPNHSDTSWMSKKNYLQNVGYGLAVLYVGLQAGDSNLTYSQGQLHGADAATLAEKAGFTLTNTVIFLDVEQGGQLQPDFLSYIEGWIDHIAANTIYMPGIYCSYFQTADQIRNTGPNAMNDCVYWVYNINLSPSPGCDASASLDPTTSEVSFAFLWQYAQNCSQTYNGVTLNVDLDVAGSANPSSA